MVLEAAVNWNVSMEVSAIMEVKHSSTSIPSLDMVNPHDSVNLL